MKSFLFGGRQKKKKREGGRRRRKEGGEREYMSFMSSCHPWWENARKIRGFKDDMKKPFMSSHVIPRGGTVLSPSLRSGGDKRKEDVSV